MTTASEVKAEQKAERAAEKAEEKREEAKQERAEAKVEAKAEKDEAKRAAVAQVAAKRRAPFSWAPKGNLDGTDEIVAVPFDAHEQATRGDEYVATELDSPDPDPETIQEFPKAIDHVDHPDPVAARAGHKEAIVVNSAEEEQAYHRAKSGQKDRAKPVASDPSDNLSDMSKPDRKQELAGMTKAELRDAADQHGVETDGSMNKGEITSALNRKINKETT